MQGEIQNEQTDILVNPIDANLSNNKSTSQLILKNAGEEVEKEL